MRINVTDIESYQDDSTLDLGLYTLEVVDADVLTTREITHRRGSHRLYSPR